MESKIRSILQKILISALISFILFQFFDIKGYDLIKFIILFFAVFYIMIRYIKLEEDIIFIFIYNCIIVLALEYKDVDHNIVYFFLVQSILLFINGQYKYDRYLSSGNNRKLISYVLIALIILLSISLSYIIYKNIILKNVDSSNRLVFQKNIDFKLDKKLDKKIENDRDNLNLKKNDKNKRDDKLNNSKKENENYKNNFDIKIVLKVLFAIFILYLIISLLKYKIIKNNIIKMEYSNKIIYSYIYYLLVLSFLGYEREIYESPLEYLNRISKYKLDFTDEFEYITFNFIRVKYGSEKINERDYINNRRIICRLNNTIRTKLSFINRIKLNLFILKNFTYMI